MTKKEVQKYYDKLSKYYGEKLANHETHPRIFAFQVKCYEYFTKSKDSSENEVIDFTKQK